VIGGARRPRRQHLPEQLGLEEIHQRAGTEDTDELVHAPEHGEQHGHAPDRVHAPGAEGVEPRADAAVRPRLDTAHDGVDGLQAMAVDHGSEWLAQT
jgi:hypothetical protein